MTRLELRRQRHLQRQEIWRSLGKVALLLTLFAMLLLPPELPMGGAKFTTWGLSKGVLRSGDPSYSLSVHPGTSMTNDSPGDPGPAFRVAEWRGGQLSLDFGTYPTGNNRNFPQVLVVHNASGWNTGLRWYMTGEVAQFITLPGPGAFIGPRSYLALGSKISSAPTDKEGEFGGTLHILTDTGFAVASLPVRLKLVKGKSNSGQDEKGSVPVVAESHREVSAASGEAKQNGEEQGSVGAEESGGSNGNSGG